MSNTILAVLSSALLCACGPHVFLGAPQVETNSIDLDNTESVRLELRMGAGELQVRGGAAKLMEAQFTFQDPAARPLVDYRAANSRGNLQISQPSGMRANSGDYKWDIQLNDQRPLDVIARLGAGEARLDLGSVSLRSIEVNMGAGEIQLDLRGTPKKSYDVRIQGGVGEATVHLPQQTGIIATAKGGLGDISVTGLEKHEGYWVRAGHEKDAVMVRVDVHGGIGQINLSAE